VLIQLRVAAQAADPDDVFTQHQSALSYPEPAEDALDAKAKPPAASVPVSSGKSLSSLAYLHQNGFQEHSTTFSAAERSLAKTLQERSPGQWARHALVFAQCAELMRREQHDSGQTKVNALLTSRWPCRLAFADCSFVQCRRCLCLSLQSGTRSSKNSLPLKPELRKLPSFWPASQCRRKLAKGPAASAAALQ
jgi:hypothetical protein